MNVFWSVVWHVFWIAMALGLLVWLKSMRGQWWR